MIIRSHFYVFHTFVRQIKHLYEFMSCDKNKIEKHGTLLSRSIITY